MTSTLEPDAAPTRIDRGVVYGDGRVLLAAVDCRLLALDAATGKLDWSVQLSSANAPGALGGSAWSPVYYSAQTGLAYIEANAIPVLRATTPKDCCFGHTPKLISNEAHTGALVANTWRLPRAATPS